MGYPTDIDEEAESALKAELAIREERRSKGWCDYCCRDGGSLPPCKFPKRHNDPRIAKMPLPPPPTEGQEGPPCPDCGKPRELVDGFWICRCIPSRPDAPKGETPATCELCGTTGESRYHSHGLRICQTCYYDKSAYTIDGVTPNRVVKAMVDRLESLRKERDCLEHMLLTPSSSASVAAEKDAAWLDELERLRGDCAAMVDAVAATLDDYRHRKLLTKLAAEMRLLPLARRGLQK